jgi:hypothetical protein
LKSFLDRFANFLEMISDIAHCSLNIPVADGPVYQKQIVGRPIKLRRKSGPKGVHG